MTVSMMEILRQYLGREISLEALRDWLALNQWDLPPQKQELADKADFGLAYLDDGYADEDFLRRSLLKAWFREG